MEISTIIKITLEEIKQMLADKKGVKHYFELQILAFDGTVLSSDTVKQPKDIPWYPDDSGEWVEVGKAKPKDLKDSDCIEYLLESERRERNYTSGMIDIVSSLGFEKIVAYKKVK